jgi:phenylacetate-CoA ligase
MYRKFAKGLLIAFDMIGGTRVSRCKNYLEKTQWMKKRDLHTLQLRRLRGLLANAYENVPYYHQSFRNSNFRPNEVRSLEDLDKVPILKRSEVRDQLDRMIARNIPKKEFVAFSTSGTTAAPIRFYRSKTDLSWGTAAGHRAYSWAGYEFGDKRAVIWAFEPERARSLKFRVQNLLSRDKILNCTYLSEEAMAQYAAKMHRFRPDFVRGDSPSANLFATFLIQNRHFKIEPKGVSTSTQMLLPHYRKTIEKAFCCKVYDFYGSREISSIAAQCGQHEALHISEENIILEIVKNGEKVSPGEEGRVLLTNLHSYVMPFIRYDIGDFGKVVPDTCACGRELSLMKPIGRTYEYFINSDGSVTFLRDFQMVFEDLPIKEFQVVQESYDEIVVKIVSLPDYNDSHTKFILDNIKWGGKARIKVELIDSIPKEKSGKVRHIVSKLATKYT